MDILEDYLAGTGGLRDAYDGMTRDQLLARPFEGKWSAMEVLCHLVDADLMTAMRIRAALQRDTPRLPAATAEELTAMLAVDARNAEEELTILEAIRGQTARIVRSFPESALDRDIVLVKVTGEEVTKTVRQLLTGITGHVKHHLAFVIEKRKALGIAA
jgi:DinB superfamily